MGAKYLFLTVMFFIIPSATLALPEKYYQNEWCAANNGHAEVVLPDGARVDCLTATHAVEFDWAKKWAEGVGQARHYAAVTGRRGAVALIVGPRDERFVKRLQSSAGSDIDIILVPRQQEPFPPAGKKGPL